MLLDRDDYVSSLLIGQTEDRADITSCFNLLTMLSKEQHHSLTESLDITTYKSSPSAADRWIPEGAPPPPPKKEVCSAGGQEKSLSPPPHTHI